MERRKKDHLPSKHLPPAKRIPNAMIDPGYKLWSQYQRSNESRLALQRMKEFDFTPLFSIVVPLYRTPVELFEAMFDSVRAQTYPRWELLLVNASPEDGGLARAVGSACAQDLRVREVRLAGNGGITLNTNEGVAAARGDYVCFFDHDDLLEPDILFEYASALNEDPSIDMLYCDEDHLAPDGEFIEPFLKPEFSIELERCVNYVCHMLTVRRSLLEELPPAGAEFDGSQDHNLVLQVAERSDRIRHVMRVLYHWRITAGSTAEDMSNKTSAFEAGALAVSEHLKRLGVPARVSIAGPGHYRVDYDIVGNPLVTIVVYGCDHPGMLAQCLDSIAEQKSVRYEVVIVEQSESINAVNSTLSRSRIDGDRVRVIGVEPSDVNVFEMLNKAAREAQGEYLLFVDGHASLATADSISVLLGLAQRESVGAVGARISKPDETLLHAGYVISDKGEAVSLGNGLPRFDEGYYGLMYRSRNVSAVSLKCMMTRKKVFENIGGFDCRFSGECGVLDYCIAVLDEGEEVLYAAYAQARLAVPWDYRQDRSHEGLIRQHEEQSLLQVKWADVLAGGDPNLNPYLTDVAPECAYFYLRY